MLFCQLKQPGGLCDHPEDIMGNLPLHWESVEVLQAYHTTLNPGLAAHRLGQFTHLILAKDCPVYSHLNPARMQHGMLA